VRAKLKAGKLLAFFFEGTWHLAGLCAEGAAHKSR